MAKGRPRKQVKRAKSGRPSRALSATYDHGTDQARERKQRYKGNGYDAIGRAYEAGLLGEDSGKPSPQAKIMLDMARSLNRAYWCEYEIGKEGCTLGKHGATTAHFGPPIRGLNDPEQERWLVRQLSLIPARERPLFDQLVLDHFPDAGPAWLDRILTGDGSPNDRARLVAATASLTRLLP